MSYNSVHGHMIWINNQLATTFGSCLIYLIPLDLAQGNMGFRSLNGTLMHGAAVIPGLVSNAVYIDGDQADVDFGTHTVGCFSNLSQRSSRLTIYVFAEDLSRIWSSFEVFVDNGGCAFQAVGIYVWGWGGGCG